ncbi:response regulator transcription factor [Paenibacillus nasutitermitis]|uniref:DNA-binding response regulator n=1 Tax=Paenibacillus nasutitermitis TaxID=1652958 RepID=A0A916YL68_9BACL|nr:response regulator [Paenibacillus nasutitermitis]GGD48467.1 hypothetical protein GCM10010911_02470 [Paenibacillus nasutitermitis]
MNIFIVDDEPLVRIGIKSSNDWEEAGMTIIGEAGDGEEALRLIGELDPDIVLLDIKMPKKDGIQVLKEIKENGFKAKVIILSSFDDFIYVKQAMKLGAVDYFHKPSMNIQEIISLLQSLKEQLSKAQGSLPLPQDQIPGKEVILRSLIEGKTEYAGHTRLREGNLHIVLFSVKEAAQVMRRYTKESPSVLQNTIRHLLGELLAKENETEFFQVEDNLFCVLIGYSKSNSTQALFAYINDIVLLIHSSLKRFVNIETVFGVSDGFQYFGKAGQAFDQAREALGMKFYQPGDPVFYYRPLLDGEEKVERIHAYVLAMKNGLMEEQYDQFATNLQEWEQYIQQHECLSEQDAKKIYEGLLFMLQNEEQVLAKPSQVEEIETFSDLSAYYHSLYNGLLRERISGAYKEYNPLVQSIIQFIENQYQESITLKMLGETFHASPNYISRVFKQEVGRGLFDYLNEIRIDKAKALLKDYRYKIYEVAEKVGFKSQVHFAIVFHKYVGKPPKEYRKEIGRFPLTNDDENKE